MPIETLPFFALFCLPLHFSTIFFSTPKEKAASVDSPRDLFGRLTLQMEPTARSGIKRPNDSELEGIVFLILWLIGVMDKKKILRLELFFVNLTQKHEKRIFLC